MKRFIKGLPNIERKILSYKQSLLRKYKIPVEYINEADVIVLDGVIVKDKYLKENVNHMGKVIIGGATPFGESKVYRNF